MLKDEQKLKNKEAWSNQSCHDKLVIKNNKKEARRANLTKNKEKIIK